MIIVDNYFFQQLSGASFFLLFGIKWLGWYLDFSAWFMKNMSIIWTEKTKIIK